MRKMPDRKLWEAKMLEVELKIEVDSEDASNRGLDEMVEENCTEDWVNRTARGK